jgi:hypothetical protein
MLRAPETRLFHPMAIVEYLIKGSIVLSSPVHQELSLPDRFQVEGPPLWKGWGLSHIKMLEHWMVDNQHISHFPKNVLCLVASYNVCSFWHLRNWKQQTQKPGAWKRVFNYCAVPFWHNERGTGGASESMSIATFSAVHVL